MPTTRNPTPSNNTLHCFSVLSMPPNAIILISIIHANVEAPTSGSTISIMMIFDTPGVRAGRVLSRMWRQAASGQSWRMWLRR